MATKIVELGMARPKWTKRGYRVYAKIKYADGKLSITGVEGPLASGNCRGSCGQIDMHKPHIDELAPGWTRAMLRRFWDVWQEWRLNDMRQGCVHQQAAGWRYEDHHGDIVLREVRVPRQMPLEVLEEGILWWLISDVSPQGSDWILMDYQKAMTGRVQLEWDPYIGHKCPFCGHRIGEGWGFQPVPADVLVFLADLPEPVHAPAWV